MDDVEVAVRGVAEGDLRRRIPRFFNRRELRRPLSCLCIFG